MEFGQLGHNMIEHNIIEHNIRKIFLQNSYVKCGETIPKLFSKKLKLSMSLDQ